MRLVGVLCHPISQTGGRFCHLARSCRRLVGFVGQKAADNQQQEGGKVVQGAGHDLRDECTGNE